MGARRPCYQHRAPRNPQRGWRGREGRGGEPTDKVPPLSHAQAVRARTAQRAPAREHYNLRGRRRPTAACGPGGGGAGPNAPQGTGQGGPGDRRKEPAEPERSKRDRRKRAAKRMAREGLRRQRAPRSATARTQAERKSRGDAPGAGPGSGAMRRTGTATAATGAARRSGRSTRNAGECRTRSAQKARRISRRDERPGAQPRTSLDVLRGPAEMPGAQNNRVRDDPPAALIIKAAWRATRADRRRRRGITGPVPACCQVWVLCIDKPHQPNRASSASGSFATKDSGILAAATGAFFSFRDLP